MIEILDVKDPIDTLKELKCPKCNKETLIVEFEDLDKYVSGVGTYWYTDTNLKCIECGWNIGISRVCTKKKIDW